MKLLACPGFVVELVVLPPPPVLAAILVVRGTTKCRFMVSGSLMALLLSHLLLIPKHKLPTGSLFVW